MYRSDDGLDDLILLALQSLVNLSLFQNYPPLFSVLWLTSAVPQACLL